MSTLLRFAEAAVVRDLNRARILLAGDDRLVSVRRRALTDHLTWLAKLVDSPDAAVMEAGTMVFADACIFGTEGDRPSREELIAAIDRLLYVVRHRQAWTTPEIVHHAAEHVPWLLDDAVIPPGTGLVLRQPVPPELARERAREYRRLKVQLWGPLALVVRAEPGRRTATLIR